MAVCSIWRRAFTPCPTPYYEYKGWSRKNDDSQIFDIEKFKEACDAKIEVWYDWNKFKPIDEPGFYPIREIMSVFRRHTEDLEK